MTRNLPINTALFLVAASLSWGCVTSEPSDAGPGDEQEQTSDPDTATDLSPQDIDLPEDQTEATPLPDSTSDIVFLDTLEDED